jgi:hypothetical protein
MQNAHHAVNHKPNNMEEIQLSDILMAIKKDNDYTYMTTFDRCGSYRSVDEVLDAGHKEKEKEE